MTIRPIRSDDDLTAALARIDVLWGAAPGTSEGDELDVLTDLVEHYEDRHHVLEPVDPVEFLCTHMEATGRSQADLAALLGSRSRASEVLNRKRALTMDMVRKLAGEWGLPPDCLLRPYGLEAAE